MKLSITLLLACCMALIYSIALNLTPTVGTAVLAQRGHGGKVAMLMPKDMNATQGQLMALAYKVAKEDGTDPVLLQAIMIKETKAGQMASYKVAGQEFGLGVNERYYGVTQMKLAAAKDVIKKFPNLKKFLQTTTDEEIIANLILNPEFALRATSKYLHILSSYRNDQDFKIGAFNRGPGNAMKENVSNLQYVIDVKRFMVQLRQKHDK